MRSCGVGRKCSHKIVMILSVSCSTLGKTNQNRIGMRVMVWEQSRRGWGSRSRGARRRDWVACQGPAWREGGMAPELAQHKVGMTGRCSNSIPQSSIYYRYTFALNYASNDTCWGPRRTRGAENILSALSPLLLLQAESPSRVSYD